MTAYLIAMGLISVALGYEISFTTATLNLGKSLSSGAGARHLQDALTPPWSTWLGYLTYALVVGGIALGWYSFGWFVGVSMIPGVVIAAAFSRLMLPNPNSRFFKQIVLRSLMNRYADFVKAGDRVRATAVADLLERLGCQVPEEFGEPNLDH